MKRQRSLRSDLQIRHALIESQRRVLDLIAGRAPLEKILETLVLLVEEQLEDMRCAVLMVDRQTQRLRFAAAPTLPDNYKRGVEPLLRVGADSGVCGTAVFKRQAVYTRDTATDPMWKTCNNVAASIGVRAVWSTPIISGDGTVRGTFAMHYGKPRLPSDDHVQLIDMAVKLARIAIEAQCDDEMLDAVFDDAQDGIVVVDVAGAIVRVNDAFGAMLGHTGGELRERRVSEFGQEEDHPSLVRRLVAAPNGQLVNYRRYRTRDGRWIRVRERCMLRRDAAGHARFVVIRVERVIGTGPDPREQLSPRESQVLELVLEGLTSKDIGARLRISATSVDTYRSRIMVKMGVGHLPGLVRVAIEHGLPTAA